MDTERWQILLKAIDRGSLRAAAEEMGFTVSGISRSVATLEKELGFALLYRAKAVCSPPRNADQLLPSVRELLFAQERLEQTAAKVRGADCGTIVIGTAYNCYYEWVTRMMAAFRTRHPGVVIKIVNGTSSELAEMLLDHRTDFCLISHRDSLPVWLPIRQDELMVLLPKNHPLADRESFPVESLKTEPFIDSYPGMETDITLIFRQAEGPPRCALFHDGHHGDLCHGVGGLGHQRKQRHQPPGRLSRRRGAPDESPPDDGDRSRLRREPRPQPPRRSWIS